MTPGEKPYICYKGRKYRDRERRLQITYGEGDCVPVVDAEQEEPMADDSDAKKFGEMLLKSVQDLSRQIEVMGQRFTAVEARQRETPRDTGKSSGMPFHFEIFSSSNGTANPATITGDTGITTRETLSVR